MRQMAPARQIDPPSTGDGGDLIVLCARNADEVSATMDAFSGGRFSAHVGGFSFYIPFEGTHAVLVVHFTGVPSDDLYVNYIAKEDQAMGAVIRDVTQNLLRPGSKKLAEIDAMLADHKCYGISRVATPDNVRTLLEGLRAN